MIGIVLMVVGFGWAILGLVNVIWGIGNLTSLGGPALGAAGGVIALMINMVIFILPGLVVGGIGTMIHSKHRATDEGRYGRGLLAKCPHCMGYVELQAKACKLCGAVMNWPTTAPSSVAGS